MKKIIYSLILFLFFYDVKAQNISFSSNGYVNHFKKIDTLFFSEYKGKKPSTKTATIDSAFNRHFLQFDSSFGSTSKNVTEIMYRCQ